MNKKTDTQLLNISEAVGCTARYFRISGAITSWDDCVMSAGLSMQQQCQETDRETFSVSRQRSPEGISHLDLLLNIETCLNASA